MINTMEKKYLKDKVATKLLSDPECLDYLLKIISAALDIDFHYLQTNYEAVDIRIGTNLNTVNSEVDIIGKTDTCFVSLEINYNYSKRLDNKNMSYICQLVLRQLDKSDQYKELLPINQICLNNYDRFGKKRFIYHSIIMEKDIHIKRSDLVNIIDIDIDFLTNISYNEVMEFADDSLERLLYIFVCDNNSLLDKIYLNNRIMDSVRRKLMDLSKNLDEYLYYDKDEIKRLDAYDLGQEEGREQGIKQGIEQGIDFAKKEDALEMLRLDMPVDVIAKITKLSIKTIEELKNKS